MFFTASLADVIRFLKTIISNESFNPIHPTKKDPKVFLVRLVGRAVKCQLDSADGLAKTGASHTLWVPNAKHLLHKVQKSHQQKKDPKVFLVRLVGLEPTRSPTRPLNVRVCHSATTASMDYVIIIFFGCQEILKKNLYFQNVLE